MKALDLPLYQTEIHQYCERVKQAFDPAGIILHGSFARGNFTPTSDIDLVIIGGNLPKNFFQRLFELNHLRDGQTPIEAIGYIQSEWQQMMTNQHLTVLETLQWGVPLMGERLFNQWQRKLTQWKSQGLRRENTSWVLPKALFKAEV